MTRATSHAVKLHGGTLVVPLNFGLLMAISLIPVWPHDPSLGAVDPAVILREAASGKRDPHTVTVLRILHTAAGDKSPGMEAIAGWGTQRELAMACVELCARLLHALAPEKSPEPKEESPPKA